MGDRRVQHLVDVVEQPTLVDLNLLRGLLHNHDLGVLLFEATHLCLDLEEAVFVQKFDALVRVALLYELLQRNSLNFLLFLHLVYEATLIERSDIDMLFFRLLLLLVS